MLEDHPEIAFLGGFCETRGQSMADIVRDRLRRRGALGAALLLIEAMRSVTRFLRHPRAEISRQRQAGQLAQRIVFAEDIHAVDILARVRTLQPDLGLVYGGPILKPQLFEIPHLGTLGIHHGKVPQYRGKKTTFWAIYNGETTAGVTIQQINAGVDAGMIVQQGEVVVGKKSVGRVTQELEALGFQLYLQSILEIKRGTARFVPQKGRKGRLYRDPKVGDLLSFWWRQLKRRWSLDAS
jgi:methionyl-tRNA formyltransferase